MKPEGTQPLGSTWFRLHYYKPELEEFTVTKSTSQTVWFKTKKYDGTESGHIRQARKGGDWFPTKREALTELRRRLEIKEERARNAYSLAAQDLKEFNRKHAGELG